MSAQQFIFVSFGSLGDVFPFLAIGKTLVDRGHQVTMISFDQHEQAARNVGLDYVPIGRWAEVEARIATTDVNDWPRVVKILAQVMTDYMEETYSAIAQRAHSRTKLVAFAPALGARIASERLGLPLATIHLAPAGIRSVQAAPRFNHVRMPAPLHRAFAPLMYALLDWVFDRDLATKVGAFRKSLGLPPLTSVRRNLDSEDLVIGLFPEWFAPPQSDWPKCLTTAHFPLYDADQSPLAAELEAFLQQGEPPIAFTAGSPTQGYGTFYRTSIEACLALNRRGLLITSYGSELPEQLPPSIMHIEYAPFCKLLPRVAALVHHGGIGTAAQALRAGTPQLIVPWGIDQFDNAKWLGRLNVAREITVSAYRPAKVTAVLRKLLESPEVLASCREVTARFDGVDTLESVCTQLEALRPANERVSRFPELAANVTATSL